MLRVRACRAAIALWIFASSAVARDLSTDERLMFAASTVLANTLGFTNGSVAVEDADHAHFNWAFAATEKVTFERVRRCTFVEQIDTGNPSDHEMQMIDFSKLTGRWREFSDGISFDSVGTSHCFVNSGRSACWTNITNLPYDNVDHRRMIDDVGFILKNGCGDSSTGNPY